MRTSTTPYDEVVWENKMMLARIRDTRPQHRVQFYEVIVELRRQPGLKREAREEETPRDELILYMLLFSLGHRLINGTETEDQEYKQINAAKKQINQQGFGNLTGLGGKT